MKALVALAILALAGCTVNCPEFQDGQFVTFKPTGDTVMVDFVDFRLYVIFPNDKFPKMPATCDQVVALDPGEIE